MASASVFDFDGEVTRRASAFAELQTYMCTSRWNSGKVLGDDHKDWDGEALCGENRRGLPGRRASGALLKLEGGCRHASDPTNIFLSVFGPFLARHIISGWYMDEHHRSASQGFGEQRVRLLARQS